MAGKVYQNLRRWSCLALSRRVAETAVNHMLEKGIDTICCVSDGHDGARHGLADLFNASAAFVSHHCLIVAIRMIMKCSGNSSRSSGIGEFANSRIAIFELLSQIGLVSCCRLRAHFPATMELAVWPAPGWGGNPGDVFCIELNHDRALHEHHVHPALTVLNYSHERFRILFRDGTPDSRLQPNRVGRPAD